VAAGLAKKCEVQLAYSIGIARPVSILVDTFGTEAVSRERISNIVNEVFDLRPAPIIEYLNLLRPIFKKTACYGHFGRNDPDFTWEKTNMVDVLREKAGMKKPRKKAARAKR
jgi:S-adenosylmethionine synthetase